MRKAARILFFAWYGIGMALMLTVGVPEWLAFSNGLFLVFYAFYALQIESGLGEPSSRLYSRALLVGVAAFWAEWIGVHTGWPFGSYVYTDELGYLTAGVPITMTCAWVGVVTSAVLLSEGSRNRLSRAVKAGLWTVLLDLVLDPVASIRGMWIWGEGKLSAPAFSAEGYYGIPAVNFISWFLLTFLFSLLYPMRRVDVGVRSDSARLMQLMLLMFGLLGARGGLLLPPIIAAGGCLLAEGVMRKGMRRERIASGGGHEA